MLIRCSADEKWCRCWIRTDETADLLTITTEDDSRLTLTPDHAIYLDAGLAAASEAKVGSLLTGANGKAVTIKRIVHGSGLVVNPVTVAGTILASDDGAPLFTASHPIWIAPYVLSSSLARGVVNAAITYVGDASSLAEGIGLGIVKAASSLVIVVGLTATALKRK